MIGNNYEYSEYNEYSTTVSTNFVSRNHVVIYNQMITLLRYYKCNNT